MVTVAVLWGAAAHVVIVWLIASCHVEGGPVTLYGHELNEFTIRACQWLVHGAMWVVGATLVHCRPVTSALFWVTSPIWLFTLPKVFIPIVAVVAWSWCAEVARIICYMVDCISNVVCAAVNAVCAAVNAVCDAIDDNCDATYRLVCAVAAFLYTVFVWCLVVALAMKAFSVCFLGVYK